MRFQTERDKMALIHFDNRERNRKYQQSQFHQEFRGHRCSKGLSEDDSTIEWNPVNILRMTRPIPLSSKPRPVKITGTARFEWTLDGGCPEVTLLNKLLRQ